MVSLEFFIGIILSLGSNQPLTEVSTRDIKKKGLEWPRGFWEIKVPRLHDNGTGWW
jgi:hypothetical protein